MSDNGSTEIEVVASDEEKPKGVVRRDRRKVVDIKNRMNSALRHVRDGMALPLYDKVDHALVLLEDVAERLKDIDKLQLRKMRAERKDSRQGYEKLSGMSIGRLKIYAKDKHGVSFEQRLSKDMLVRQVWELDNARAYEEQKRALEGPTYVAGKRLTQEERKNYRSPSSR